METYAQKQALKNALDNEQICSRKVLSSLKSEMVTMRSNMSKLLKSKSA